MKRGFVGIFPAVYRGTHTRVHTHTHACTYTEQAMWMWRVSLDGCSWEGESLDGRLTPLYPQPHSLGRRGEREAVKPIIEA